MATDVGADRFDEQRQEWIKARQGESLIQRRRAEELGRRVRARQRDRASAVPDPHDDTILPRLIFRQAKSLTSRIEAVSAMLAALTIPLSWFGGYIAKRKVATLIPTTLRAYPIAALLWSGIGLGLLTILATVLVYDPAGSFEQVVVLPWLCAQVAAVPLVAGVYGLADGWLAVDGSALWFPLTPPKQPLTATEAATILGGYDATGPGIVDAQPLNEPGE